MILQLQAALACGGFFCDGGTIGVLPVLQTSEVIAFGVADGRVEMHVQVAYEGPADEFAWVLPVPAVPEIQRSSAGLFRGLDPRTRLELSIVQVDDGCSESDADTDADTDADSDADLDEADSDPIIPGVVVVSQQEVGPYQTVVLEAADSNVLVAWLAAAGFNTPPGLADTLAPYGAPSTRYVALRLLSDRDVGDIEPFSLSYEGDTPSIPIRLTSVAAADDMPITVYVVGDERAVPANYLHVELNPLAMDWSAPDQTALVTRAADEAGGQAFATISSIPTDFVRLPGAELAADGLAQLPDLGAWLAAVVSTNGFTAQDLERVIELPDGVDPAAFFVCPTCFPEVDLEAFDLAAISADFDEQLLAPLRAAQAMIDRGARVTRLESSASPDEMTLDPRFVFAPGMPVVPNRRTLEVRRSCADGPLDDQPHVVTAEGLTVVAPSARGLGRLGFASVFEWLRVTQDMASLRIEEGSEAGLSVLVDNRDAILARNDPDGDGEPDADPTAPTARDGVPERACGCAGAPGAGAFGVLAALALGRRRRG